MLYIYTLHCIMCIYLYICSIDLTVHVTREIVYLYIHYTVCVYIYICSIDLTVHVTREIALNRGHLC